MWKRIIDAKKCREYCLNHYHTNNGNNIHLLLFICQLYVDIAAWLAQLNCLCRQNSCPPNQWFSAYSAIKYNWKSLDIRIATSRNSYLISLGWDCQVDIFYKVLQVNLLCNQMSSKKLTSNNNLCKGVLRAPVSLGFLRMISWMIFLSHPWRSHFQLESIKRVENS